MNLLIFDIETIPDVDSGKKLYDLEGLSDADVANAMFLLRREKVGNDFLPHHLQKIVAISVVIKTPQKLAVKSLGDLDSTEAEIIELFYKGIEHYKPILISWNGGGFDLPVLHYRALLHKISAPHYWENGQEDPSFKFNNYLSRYHERHTDLMDVLASYGRGVPLDELATMLGFPGKMGMSGDKVWEAYQAGGLAKIRNYCETDVLNTYLVYLRYQLFRGRLSPEQLAREEQLVRETLAQEDKPHFGEFLGTIPPLKKGGRGDLSDGCTGAFI